MLPNNKKNYKKSLVKNIKFFPKKKNKKSGKMGMNYIKIFLNMKNKN